MQYHLLLKPHQHKLRVMDNSVKIEDLVATANPATNVIIANGGMFDEMNDAVNYFLEPEYWDYEEAEGPLCHLCGEGILDKSNILIYNGTTYTIIFKDDMKRDDWRIGTLQCVYCMNFYHKNRCNITVSDYSYWNITSSKIWACPNCVPIFICETGMTDVVNCKNIINYNKLLLKLAKLLNPLRSHFNDVTTTIDYFNYRYDLLHKIFDNFGIG